MTITRVGALSFARIAGAIYAVLGLIFGALISLFAVLEWALSSSRRGVPETPLSPLLGAVMGIGAIVICPILYGLLGFFFALIAAWFYNVIASKVGGIEIDITQSDR